MKPQRNIIGFPTESFYALGVPANDPIAIRALFRMKKREAGKPIALIAGSLQQVQKFFHLSATELAIAQQHWPGPLTILLRPKTGISARSLGAQKIGVRVPSHKGARMVAKKIGSPITATSANLSGEPPTKSARVVKDVFPDILMVSGRCGRQSKPSTIIDVRKGNIHIIRQGAVHV